MGWCGLNLKNVQIEVLSISNGQCIIQDMARRAARPEGGEELGPFLDQLRSLPFTRSVEAIEQEPADNSRRFDATVQVETEAGSYEFLTEVKRSYLDEAVTRAITAAAKNLTRRKRKLLLFARYIPQPTAQRLMDAGVDFADLAGNVHLNLPPHYHWTVVGNRETQSEGRGSIETPATLQLLFTIAAHPESAEWTVRELASRAGVSKSKAASTRRELLYDQTIRKVGGRFQFADPKGVADRLLSGYRQILRPRLVIGRFRSPESDIESFVERLRNEARSDRFRYALTGGLAAYQLQRFYKGEGGAAFVAPNQTSLPKMLRLLPDRDGPIALLKAFGEIVYWRSAGRTNVAHPWLIYAELMAASDPRAHEAAEELRKEFSLP